MVFGPILGSDYYGMPHRNGEEMNIRLVFILTKYGV